MKKREPEDWERGTALFVNECTYSQEHLEDWFQNNKDPRSQKRMRIFLCALSAVVGVLFLGVAGEVVVGGFYLLLAALAMPAGAWLEQRASRGYARTVARQVAPREQEPDRVKSFFYQDGIAVQERSRRERWFSYRQLRSVRQGETIYILRTTRMIVLVAKQGFLTGTAPEFEAFLQEKMDRQRAS